MNTPVSFELAKLLKEKGFDENCKFGYNGEYEPHHLKIIEFGYLQRNFELLKLVYSAPTIADVVMWLYEKHGIWLSVDTDINGRLRSIIRKYNPVDKAWEVKKNMSISEYFNSPIEAYEADILHCLKKLM
jgi:hypothetical protein